MVRAPDLSSLAVSGDIPGPRFAERCRADLELRWRAGERICSESYFAAFPDKFEDRESSLLLIYCEYLLREARGERPLQSEFLERFPRLGNELLLQFQLHAALGPESTSPLSAAGELVSTLDSNLELFEEIGRGGMGIVHRGYDSALDRELAVKVLRTGSAAGSGAEGRFWAEARTGGRLQHPGIVPVHQIGRLPDGRPFFTMKLVEGRTLAALLSSRTDPADDHARFLDIFGKVCQAVAYAHERGVIHRDIKPANVMVGRFGEVQVMDWGLSKLLESTAATGEISELSLSETAFGSRTLDGTIIGTPGYMAPEQARGLGERLDARTDVFGLGALLCEILTGKPPFTASDPAAVVALTARAELAEAYDRMERCGADGELVALAKRCLNGKPESRPTNAAAVSEAIFEHMAGRETRLRRAEWDHASAVAKAAAERRARRLTSFLSVAGVLLAFALAALAIRYQRDRSQQATEQVRRSAALEQDVRYGLRAAREQGERARNLVEDPTRWEATLASALTAVRRAATLPESEGLAIDPVLQREVEAALSELETDDADRRFVAALEAIRLVPDGFNAGATPMDREQFGPAYRDAFGSWGLDVPAVPAGEAVAKLSRRPAAVRAVMTAMLDDWLAIIPRGSVDPTATWIRDVLREIETDPWLREVRELRFLPGTGKADLLRLADGVDFAFHPPAAFYLLGTDLFAAGELPKAVDFLRSARNRHPSDFRMNFILARMLVQMGRHDEALRYYEAARILRPDDARLLVNLGNALYRTGDLTGAEAVYRQAMARDAGLAGARIGLGLVRKETGDVAGAIGHFQSAIDLDPKSPAGHQSLANVFLERGELDKCLSCCARAMELDPNSVKTYETLGFAHAKRKEWSDAVKAFSRATELDPSYARNHFELGMALRALKDWPAASRAFRRASELDPADGKAFHFLGQCHWSLRDWPAASTALERAVELGPRNAVARAYLGSVRRHLKDLPGSIAMLKVSLDLDEKSPWTHLQMGHALQSMEDAAGSAAEFRRAISLNADSAEGHFGLGKAMWKLGDLEKAEAAFRRATVLTPNDAHSHCNLGLVLRNRGRFGDAVECLKRGHALGSHIKDWNHPSERWLRDTEKLVELDRKLPDALSAKSTPDPAELLELADLSARYHTRYADAVRLASQAFSREPRLADGLRVNAARWAALAAAGRGLDAPPVGTERSNLGRQSRDWLRAELAVNPFTPEEIRAWKTLLRHPDFADFLEEAKLYRLLESDRAAWRVLWDDLRLKLDMFGQKP